MKKKTCNKDNKRAGYSYLLHGPFCGLANMANGATVIDRIMPNEKFNIPTIRSVVASSNNAPMCKICNEINTNFAYFQVL